MTVCVERSANPPRCRRKFAPTSLLDRSGIGNGERHMRKSQQPTLSAVLAAAIGAATVGAATVGAVLLDGVGLAPSAQAQNAEERRRQEQERQRAAPPRQQQPAQQYQRQQQPERQRQQPPERPAQQFQRQQQPERPAQQFQRQQQPERPAQQFQRQQPPERPAQQFQRQQQPERPAQQFQPPPAKPAEGPPAELKKKEGIQRFERPPGQPGMRPPPSTFQNAPPLGPGGPARPQTVTPETRPGQPTLPGAGPKRFEDMKRFRVERTEKGGERKVIQEPDRRFIVRERNQTIVRHDESERFLRRPGARSERRSDGTVETFYSGRNGARVCTVVDANGRLVRRFRIGSDGREHNIIDNRRFYRNVAIGVGIGALGIIALNLPPPRVTIPDDEYIVDYDRASDDDLYDTLSAPPLEDLDRPYSLEEIRDNYELRARVRTVDIDTIAFEFGAWEVTPDQYGKLERIARAILRVLDSNPDAVFLIAGHTDAVGSDEDNASLSDRRAAAVADVLTEQFDVPAENLVTQGYGEQYLKVDTQDPEPRNRRVSIQNVTGLMAER
jgi:outer membrane protein OmpA-like peptidoglycan-associated protein